jgi:hypothetical protein
MRTVRTARRSEGKRITERVERKKRKGADSVAVKQQN